MRLQKRRSNKGWFGKTLVAGDINIQWPESSVRRQYVVFLCFAQILTDTFFTAEFESFAAWIHCAACLLVSS